VRYAIPAVDAVTGELLVPSMSVAELDAALRARLPNAWPQAKTSSPAAERGLRLRRLIERAHAPDLADPHAVGWTYLVAADDPGRDAITRALKRLARHRGMNDAQTPLVFSDEAPEDWQDWIEEHYGALSTNAPHYILIVGGPDRVPFHFQAVLATAASVGRLAFEKIEALEAYVEKVLRLESSSEGSTERQALMFATDRGTPDPTYYSRRYMAEPIAQHLGQLGVPVRSLYAADATSTNLLEALTSRRFALIYTATHGAVRPRTEIAIQRDVNGAIVCTAEPGATEQSLLAARDVPADDVPVAEGAIVFEFACFGAGTPVESDYAHWLGRALPVGGEDFVAALPSRLLAHPRGPIAFIGHVDLAWLDAFDDPDDPDIATLWHPRLNPFLTAVKTFLDPQPVGLGMAAINKRFNLGNAGLATAFDRQQRGKLPEGPTDRQRLVRAFIARSDAQNYLVLGDPAVYPRMST
jgi:hypothetical protein